MPHAAEPPPAHGLSIAFECPPEIKTTPKHYTHPPNASFDEAHARSEESHESFARESRTGARFRAMRLGLELSDWAAVLGVRRKRLKPGTSRNRSSAGHRHRRARALAWPASGVGKTAGPLTPPRRAPLP